MITNLKKQNRFNEIEGAVKKLNEEHKGMKSDVPKDLAYLAGENKDNYLHDMALCQEYASLNRRIIANMITAHLMAQKVLGFDDFLNCNQFETIHNYIDLETNIIRKGAISAKENEKVLIPLNMRDGCIIAVGKGNPDWNFSAPHGAGRIMSRIKAKKEFTMGQYQASMVGIFTTSINEST